ncbi:MAG: helix-turn-helix domain-containing protein [Coriobacteriia bacterium]|nr:helix-turn-helix domain-containing protein [Coriobacteriia bacterium]
MAGKQRLYRRLDKADRVAIENGLDKRKSCRQMAAELGRSPSTVADEVSRNRSVSRGPGRGGRAGEAPGDACARLLSWPRCCNGCKLRRYHCSKRWRVEYSAARAQAMADEELSASRMGVDRGEAEFESMMAAIRSDVARGLSPAQIAASRAGQFEVSASTIYRWIERGYAGMSSLELRRKCGYKRRTRAAGPRATAHGEARSFGAFMGLSEEERAAACEMDTVVGARSDRQCLLTLYQRPCKFQLALLMPGKDSESTAGRLDALERAVC